MLDNNNMKQDNQNNDKKENTLNHSAATLIVFLVIFVFFSVVNFGLGSFMKEVEKDKISVDKITLSSYTIEEEIRCVSITALYDVDGTKNYSVRFIVPKYDIYLDGVVPASMIDENCVIDKDSRYIANVTYTYPNEIINIIKSKTIDTKGYENDYDYLKNVENVESVVQISNIECMFSEYLSVLTEEEIKDLFETNLITKK